MITRASREKNVVAVVVDLAPAVDDKPAQVMNVEMRRTGRGYGQVKQLVDQSRAATKMTTQASRKKRELTRLQARLDEIIANSGKIQSIDVSDGQKRAVATAANEAALDEVSEQLDTLKDEISEIEANAASSIEALIDWMVGEAVVEGAEVKVGAIADWDFYEDDTQTTKVPINREALEGFEPAEIALIANKMLEAINVSGQNAPG